MEIKTGETRVVFLVGDRAIKFGKIRIVRLFFRIFLSPFMSKEKNRLFYEAYGRYLLFGVLKYLTVGINANRREYEYYRNTKDLRVAPTRKMLFYGWIVIQDRGTTISQKVLIKNNPFKNILSPLFSEKHEPWQFCQINNQIVLADYGREEIFEILKNSLTLSTP